MRIGINTLFLVPGDVGGTEVYLRKIMLAIAETHPGDSLILFTSLDNDSLLREELGAFHQVEFVKLPFSSANRPLRIIVEQLYLPFKVLGRGIDILWSPGYTAPFFSPSPQVVTIHDLQYKRHPEDMKWIERITFDILVTLACKRSESIITVSEFSRREIIDCQMAAGGKIKAIHSGVDPDFSTQRNPDRNVGGINIPDVQPYILCVAHTYPHKNIHLLIDAFCLLEEMIPHHLVIVGKARRGEGKVEESLERIKYPHRMHRMTHLGLEELKLLYKQADLFVFPSEYEGFGLPILEALCAGVPVVAAEKASIPEVGGPYVHYVGSLSAEGFASGIKAVLALDGKLKKKMIKEAQNWASSFTWTQSAGKTLQVFKESAGLEEQ
jgi:glycosyltransferase involved in cell wall biosynthesis